MSITFSTAWYVFKSKFDTSTYESWIDNLLSNVNAYYLVVYTDVAGSQYIEKYLSNPRIKMIIKPVEEFFTYQFKDYWVYNHSQNHLLNERIDWQLNMLWSEKISFVNETKKNNYFGTKWFGWTDIGYFRDSSNKDLLRDWPNAEKIDQLCKDKVYYACINNRIDYINTLAQIIQDKNDWGLPRTEIPPYQVSVAGGFFICHNSKVEWWNNTYYERLSNYFQHGYLVKDDQIVIVDCIFSEEEHFQLVRENIPELDNWFLFQRFLSH
uniref:Nucleotide-diphospho-sugar transferase domain-containing protein n=1 Tax=viral metagenome TaxID=1070528 RepID=A0A6C0JJ45_9ZZZZ